jgi:hypothetical protein
LALPNWLLDRERCCDAPGAYTFPHLHPIGGWPSIDFRPREKMHMIGHQNVVAHPPAIVISGAQPDFMQNVLAFMRSKNPTPLVSARCEEDNWIVAERGQVRQMAKCS